MASWMDGPLKGFFTDRQLQSSEPTTEMVELIPFDVILARVEDEPVNPIALTDAVNSWMHVNFGEAVERFDYDFDFHSMRLRELDKQEVSKQFKITYEGQTVWMKSSDVPSEIEVATLQVEVMENRAALLALLRSRSKHFGLGEAIVDVRTVLNRDAKTDIAGRYNTNSSNESLDVIIIIAIVVAVLASLLLLFALIMAWKTGKERKQQAYLDTTPQNTDTTSPVGQSPPQEISNNANANYPESVISEDISTSLSAYYKSGMAGGYKANKNKVSALNDAASVSSMESYGYSLDGYASSIAP